MSKQARIGLVVGTLAVLVIAFRLLAPGDDSKTSATTPQPATSPPSTATTTTPTATGGANARTPPAPTYTTIRVKGGQPVGGVKTITVDKGDRVRIQVSSPDTSDEIHLHGYDLSRDLKAGGRVRFSFKATADGIYEIELESVGTQIGKLVVEP
jgi:heme/copper-type cytochrome/quinol oxidase subunit 2